MNQFRNLLVTFIVFFSLACAGQALAVPTFTSGFDGWEGYLSDGSPAVETDLATDPHFGVSGNVAIISYSDLSDPYWTFTLSQTTPVDQLLGAGNRLNLSFYMKFEPGQDVTGQPGTFDGHIVSATFGSDALIDTTDSAMQSRLLAGDTFTADITNYAGTSALLAFTLGDLDWSVTDSLLIGNFSFSQVAPPTVDPPTAPVPEPSTMLLLGAGLAGLGIYRKRTMS